MLQTRQTCACCKKLLPMSEFYRSARKDNYCKKCRCEYNKRYQVTKSGKKRDYMVVTEIEDPMLRLEQIRILHGKIRNMVSENIRKRINEEGESELRYMKGGNHGTH